nr:ATPase family AAA domain-containing protein 5b isoform X2 [Nothobranchius furzeri]
MRNKPRRNKNLQNAASNAEEGRERPTGPIVLSSSSEDDSAADRKESRSSRRKGANIATVFLRNQRGTSKRSSDGEPGRPEVRLLQKTEPLPQRDDVRSSQLTANHGLAESSRREQMTPADLQSCLEKIKALNPAFPVQSVFCSLQRKSRQKLQEASGDCRGGPKEFLSGDSSHPDTSCERLPKRPRSSPPPEAAAGSCFVPGQEVHGGCIPKQQRSDRKLSRSHRLKQRERLHPTTSDKLRGSCLEDRLWTDKYCPQHSNQLIGNSASVSKLHSWLKSWKRGSDAEDGRLTGDGKHKGSWDCGDFQGEAVVRNGREEPLSNGVLLTGPSGVGKTASVYACAQELGFKVFEVNSSSQRCGRQVLSQLREATRSHLVEPSGEDPLKPVYFNNYNQSSFSPKPGREQLPRSITSSSKTKTVPNSCSAGGKVKTRAAALARYFETKEKADLLHFSGILPSGTSDTEERDNASLICDQSGKQNNETAMSLILFEEVDVIFEDDVGFVAAIRSFLTTTKRPVVLTSNDPFLRERFSCSLEEIVFKTPPAASVCSYLQLTCLAEDAWVDSADVSRLLRLTGGDVRRCLLQLQLWVCSSSRGRTCQPGRLTPARSLHCKASVGGSQRPPYQPGCSDYMLGLLPVTPDYLQNTLKSPSWSESDLTKLLNHLAESWSQGVPLLYSNLKLLLPSSLLHLEDKPDPPQQKGFIRSDDDLHTQLAGQRRWDTSGQSVRSVSRLSRRKRAVSKFPSPGLTNSQTRLCETWSRMPSFSNKAGKQTAEAAAGRLDALADLFDLMSYVDATLTEAELLVSGSNTREAFVWTGATITDGVSDKMGEEVGGRRNQDVKAAVEGLGFHRFWRGDSETWTRAQRSKQDLEDKPRGRQQDTQLFVMSSTNQNVSFTPHPACAASESDSRSRVSQLVLSSAPFSLLGNRRAVCVDYMPVLRSFCHKLRVNQRGETGEGRRSHPSLPKSTLRLLAQDVTLRKPRKDS